MVIPLWLHLMNERGHRVIVPILTDIPHMSPKFRKVVPPFHRQGNGIPSAAKVVLRDGTSEEIEAVEKGKAAVSTTAKRIRQGIPEEQPPPLHPV